MNYKVMVKALNVIKDSVVNTDFPLTNKLADAIYAIEAELAKPEQWGDSKISDPVFLKSQRDINGAIRQLVQTEQEPIKEWVGLSETEIRGCTCECVDNGTFTMACAIDFARALEATLKDKNTTN